MKDTVDMKLDKLKGQIKKFNTLREGMPEWMELLFAKHRSDQLEVFA